jgi:ribA/ribD-fused uncharacterized protein
MGSVRARGCLFFYSHKKGEFAAFSQFAQAHFVDEDGFEYACAEQYMMASKARVMGDEKTREEILACGYDPTAVKALGRRVKPFDQARWEVARSPVVAYGNFLKFGQNKGLRKLLLSTGTDTLVEAARNDSIWGIGLSLNDAAAGAKWRGLNLLGQALMAARAALADGTRVEPWSTVLQHQLSAAGAARAPEPEPGLPAAKKQRSDDSVSGAMDAATLKAPQGRVQPSGTGSNEGACSSEVVVTGERTREQRDAELRKHAVDVDAEPAARKVKTEAGAASGASGSAGGSAGAGSSGGGGGSLVEQVDKIKRALTLDSTLEIRAAIQAANQLIGLSSEGTLPAQAAALLKSIGL